VKIVIKNKNGVNIELHTTDAGCKTVNGSITITPVNGTGPCTFKINGGQFQSGNTFANLSQGDYAVIAKDSIGCEASQSITIKSGISFAGAFHPLYRIPAPSMAATTAPNFRIFRTFKTSRTMRHSSKLKPRSNDAVGWQPYANPDRCHSLLG